MQRRTVTGWMCVLASLPLSSLAQGTAAEADGGGSLRLEEIIVSARRREETLSQTPVAITAISTRQLEGKAAINMTDLQGAAPNVLITSQNSGAATANLSIRGLTFADVEKSFDPTVAVVVDGVFMGTSTGQVFDYFDIEKIEVLRGPQGTLFGRNTIGGVINITRTRPTGELGAKLEVSYGKYDTRAVRAVFNAPVIGDHLAAKLFYFQNQSDGFYRHAILDRRVGESDNENFGAALLWSGGPGNFEALLTLEKQQQKFEPTNANIARTGEVFCAFEPPEQCDRNTKGDLYTVFGDRMYATYSSPAATLELNFDAGPVHFTSVTGYRSSDENHRQDFDASSAALYHTRRVQDYEQFSQELRASGQITNALDYVVGLYYFDSDYELIQYTSLFGAPPGDPQLAKGSSKSSAVFADFNWAFAERFRLNFGGRYTEDKKSFENGFGDVVFGSPSKKFDKFTTKIGLDYRPIDDLMFYASWSEGYRSGGFSNRAQTVISTNTPYGPETVSSTEVGAKVQLFENRLALNLAVFNAKYDDLQQNTTIPGGPTGNETIVTNVGSATIRGIELDATARVTQWLTLTAALGLLDTDFDDFITQAPVNGELRTFDYSRNHMIYSPDVTASLGAELEIPVSFGELRASLTWRYIDEYDQQISDGSTAPPPPTGVIVVPGNDPRVRAKSQNLLDASVSTLFDVGEGRARVTLYGRNLTDDRGPNAAFTVAGLWSFSSAREPRTYGIQLGYEF